MRGRRGRIACVATCGKASWTPCAGCGATGAGALAFARGATKDAFAGCADARFLGGMSPAGHLRIQGGDRMGFAAHQILNVGRMDRGVGTKF